jgi:hypothetical protein
MPYAPSGNNRKERENTMIDEFLIGRDSEGSGRVLIDILLLHRLPPPLLFQLLPLGA